MSKNESVDAASMHPIVTCLWDKAWIGPCRKPAGSNGFCDEHTGKTCASCGGMAVRECDHTGIQFVCGFPLCKTCQHGIPEEGKEGLFMLGGGHVTNEVHVQQFEAKYGKV